MTYRDLLNKLQDKPFRPFRVWLSTGSAIDVLDPGTVVVGPTRAIMPLEAVPREHGYYVVLRWRTVALGHMAEFIDIDPPKSGSKRKRAS